MLNDKKHTTGHHFVADQDAQSAGMPLIRLDWLESLTLGLVPTKVLPLNQKLVGKVLLPLG